MIITTVIVVQQFVVTLQYPLFYLENQLFCVVWKLKRICLWVCFWHVSCPSICFSGDPCLICRNILCTTQYSDVSSFLSHVCVDWNVSSISNIKDKLQFKTDPCSMWWETWQLWDCLSQILMDWGRQATTLCLKKVPTFELSVTLSNLNRFSKF